jgi:GST-like protein
MASYPRIVTHKGHGQSLDDFPHLKRFEAIAKRPAEIKAYAGTEDSYSSDRKISDEERKVLFGAPSAKAAS